MAAVVTAVDVVAAEAAALLASSLPTDSRVRMLLGMAAADPMSSTNVGYQAPHVVYQL